MQDFFRYVMSAVLAVVTAMAPPSLPFHTQAVPPVLSAADASPSDTLARDQCLAISLGLRAASECGDLRLAHALPSVRTYEKDRAPVLIYNSDHASPHPVVAANVALSAVNLSRVTAVLRVNGRQRALGQWTGASWPTTGAARIAVAYDASQDSTNVYRYTLDVTAFYGADSATSRMSGRTAVVNRVASVFGAGWWIDGLEQLFVDPFGNPGLWIGGDGSVRRYMAVRGDTTAWTAASIDRPDTLKRSNGGFERIVSGGVRVRFDAQGHHVATVNRLGHTTTFGYDGQNRLQSIVIPPSAAAASYAFAYGSGNRLQSVTLSAGSGSNLLTRVATLSDSGGRVVAITDPDGIATGFGYDGPVSGRVTSRTDKRGTVTHFRYADGIKVSGSMTELRTPGGALADSITQRIVPAETQGLMGGDPVAVAAVSTLLDGPRLDVADTTRFYLNRFGAPRVIRDALGQVTTIAREDARFGGLVTSVVQPNGFTTTSDYDAAGHVLHQTALAPYGDGRNATTTYAWNMQWDDVTKITSPEGDSTTVGIDPATGLRLWQQDGALGRTQFTYTGNRQVATVQSPGNDTLHLARYEYDAMGNLARSTSALGFAVQYVRDALGRDTLVLTPTDAAQTPALMRRDRTVYNLAGRVDSTIAIGAAMSYTLRSLMPDTAVIEPDSAFTSNSYDAEGRLISHLTRPSFSAWSNRRVSTSESWSYDALGRAAVHVRNGFRDSTVFDPAGNAIQTTTAAGRVLTQHYDALSRLISRVDTARTASRQRCEGLLAGPITDPNVLTNCFVVFPAYPNAADGGYAIPRDSASFQYDVTGGLSVADNADAQVHRQYYPNGAVRLDSALTRAATGAGFTHASRLAYHYDRAGRRDTLFLPDGGAMGFTYRPDNGALATVVDPLGNPYHYTYDAAGRIDSLIVGAHGVMEHRSYDADGRQFARQRVSAVFGQLNAEQLTFDAQGRVTIAAYSTRANQAPPDTTYLAYAGLGAVLARERREVTGNWETEEFRTDGLGNVLRSRTQVRDKLEMPQASTYASRGALVARDAVPNPDYPLERDQLVQGTDAQGQMVRSHRTARDRTNTVTADTPSHNYYGWDGRLRAVQRYRWVSGGQEDGTWEEYRYDALGRRVLTIARPGGTPPGCAAAGLTYCSVLCNVVCIDAVTWARYDGAQLVREERRAYPDGSIVPPSFGIVQYVPGLSIDAPLAALRDGSSLYVLTPHWRGRAESSVDATGAAMDASLAGGPSVRIAWPVGDAVYQRPTPTPDAALPITWLGSAVTEQRDGTGYQYRRNRYYNPEAGQFTQEDPIGLAGGMNLYGFASGDPVNFSDPFGLCPPEDNKACPWMHEEGLHSGGWADPLAWLSGGIAAGIERGLASVGTQAVTSAGARVAANKVAGDAFRDEIASAFESNGYGVAREVGKKTPFGRRVIDVEVSRNGEVLGGIEAKAGKSRYLPWQMAKDEYLRRTGYPVQLVRDATAVKVSGLP